MTTLRERAREALAAAEEAARQAAEAQHLADERRHAAYVRETREQAARVLHDRFGVDVEHHAVRVESVETDHYWNAWTTVDTDDGPEITFHVQGVRVIGWVPEDAGVAVYFPDSDYGPNVVEDLAALGRAWDQYEAGHSE